MCFFFTSKAHNMIKWIIVICYDKLWSCTIRDVEKNAHLAMYKVSFWAGEKIHLWWCTIRDVKYQQRTAEHWAIWSDASFEMHNMFEMCVLYLLRCKVWWQRRMWDAQPQLVEQLLSVKVPDAQFDSCWMHFWWSAQCVRCQQCIFCGPQYEMLSLI